MTLSAEQMAAYGRDGFVLLPGLLDADEVATLRGEVARLARVEDECVFREGEAGTVKTMFRMHEADGPTASAAFRALAHSPRALGAARRVLGDEALYLHHSKVNMKGAVQGSVWPWHQDFGSWHLDGIAAPDMTTLMVMLDASDPFNGCLYFLPGSHKGGRIEPYRDESTAYKLWSVPPAEMRALLDDGPEPVAITGRPGDGALFHCNLLHASGHNLSAGDRWQAYFCYNRVANRPIDVDRPRPDYVRSTNWTPMELTDDARVAA